LLNPSFYSAQNLPQHLKDKGNTRLQNLIDQIKDEYWCVQHIENAMQFANSANIWNDHGEEFIHNTVRRDKIRNEDFTAVFPELSSMLNG